MRLVIILQSLLIAVNSCEDFWRQWGNITCASSAKSCHITWKQSSIEVFDDRLVVRCKNETIHPNFLSCLNSRNMRILEFTDCYLENFHFGAPDLLKSVILVNISYEKYGKDFHSVSFTNMPSLKFVGIYGKRNGDNYNLTFGNLPSLTVLKIKDYDFGTVPSKPFENLTNLSELHVTNGKLRGLKGDIFDGLYNLNKLILNDNWIDIINPEAFRNLSRVEFIDLSNNQIAYLPPKMLHHVSDLKEILLCGNRRMSRISSVCLKGLKELTVFNSSRGILTNIEEDLFSDALSLTRVDISSNRIVSLPTHLFRNNKNLREFHCSENQISKLPERIFNGLFKLKLIDLSKNSLESLPEYIFMHLKTLEKLYLSRNRIKLLSHNVFLPLENLELISLSYNNFDHISGSHPFGKSKRLKYIKVKNSNLKVLPKINWTYHDLIEVDFTGNSFETVKLPIYTKNPVKIYLTESRVKTIYIDDWQYGLNTPYINLNYIRLKCDEELEPFINTIKSNLDVTLKIFPDLKTMTCNNENRKVIDDRPFSVVKYHCPPKCNCFREEEDVKINCSGKELTRVPVSLIENATIVDLSNNNITEFPNVDCHTWSKVTELDLSNSNLTAIPNEIPSGITYLSLDRNHLTNLPSALMQMIDVSANFKAMLSRNNWKCDCNSLFTKDWLLRNKQKILDFNAISCGKDSMFSSFEEIVSSDYCRNNSE